MERKRKLYTDKFKLDVVREALWASEKQAEIAVKHDISSVMMSDGFSFSSTESWRQRK